jgi:hypothetical protein
MSDTIRAFVNGHGVSVPRGAAALDAVRAWDAAEAAAIAAGSRIITDSRGLPTDPASPIQAGAIFRTLPNRGAAADHDEPTAS